MNYDELSVLNGWESASATHDATIAAQIDMRKKLVNFGIPFLDESLKGIFRGDLILLGAQSGRGKTQTAMLIAKSAAMAGKKVFFFALEAEPYEIQRRFMFASMRDKSFSSGDFMTGLANEEVISKMEETKAELSKLTNLYIYYKKGDFGYEALTKQMLQLRSIADIFFVDHFHFLDFFATDNENQQHKEAMRAIRDTALAAQIPVVLLAHMNKAYSKSENIIPTMYDFYGTSDLANICTKCITLSHKLPESITKDHDTHRHSKSKTIFHVSKSRMDMSVTNFFGCLEFNYSTGAYGNNYLLGRMGSDYPIMDPTDIGFPEWAKSAKGLRPYEV